MTKESVFNDILKILSEDCEVDTGSVTLDSKLIEDLGLESLALLTLLTSLENKYQRKIDVETFEVPERIDDLIDMIQKAG